MMQTSSEWLVDEFVSRKRKNFRYSERAFAKSVGLSPGFLKLLFQGKRALSMTKAKEVANRLGWSELESKVFLSSLQQEKDRKKNKELTDTASVEKFFEISDWHHFAIVEIVKTKKETTAKEIAKRLGISSTEVIFSLRVLAKHGLIKLVNGNPEAVQNYIVPAISSSAIRKFHAQMLSKAITALEGQSIEEREMRSLTLAFDKKRKAEAAQMLKEFMQRFEKRFGSGKTNCVYQLSLAFFSLETGESL